MRRRRNEIEKREKKSVVRSSKFEVARELLYSEKRMGNKQVI
jgi:hypothetical protein